MGLFCSQRAIQIQINKEAALAAKRPTQSGEFSIKNRWTDYLFLCHLESQWTGEALYVFTLVLFSTAYWISSLFHCQGRFLMTGFYQRLEPSIVRFTAFKVSYFLVCSIYPILQKFWRIYLIKTSRNYAYILRLVDFFFHRMTWFCSYFQKSVNRFLADGASRVSVFDFHVTLHRHIHISQQPLFVFKKDGITS